MSLSCLLAKYEATASRRLSCITIDWKYWNPNPKPFSPSEAHFLLTHSILFVEFIYKQTCNKELFHGF